MHPLENKDTLNAEAILVKGTVQGVGYRPFVWQLAKQFQLRGKVWNNAEGVMIHAWGNNKSLHQFRKYLKAKAPPLAKVTSVTAAPLNQLNIPYEFLIVNSVEGKANTNVSTDATTCPHCLSEINNPEDRRYRYAFTNCTHCGPRFSIITAIPYDRKNTSMYSFTMCNACEDEYNDPDNRRFHAQPNACPDCGPETWLENSSSEKLTDNTYTDAIEHATQLLKQGFILAIKGIGGFHLACDATNETAVSELRTRKRRYQKPFALMARGIDIIERYAEVNNDEKIQLQNIAAPIVLLNRNDSDQLVHDVAPEQNLLGFMLPYSPLHYLLLQAFDTPLVFTSGNRSDEAQCISNEQARVQLSGIADYFLFHNREIVNRLDDSVVRVTNHRTKILRRARGYSPAPSSLPEGFSPDINLLAMGAELKNTFCLVQNGQAILSQHQGDLEDASVLNEYYNNIQLYQKLYQHTPDTIVVDAHPDYLSTKHGKSLSVENNLPLISVQHHHAHIAACMAEHGLPVNTKPVLGIALDGLGFATSSHNDGSIWGGEFLLTDYLQAERVALFPAVAMPGGTKAILEPWRNTFAHLHHAIGWQNILNQYPEHEFIQYMQEKPVENLLTMIDKNLNSPPASSAGRLFDAVAGLLNLCRDKIGFEGQAAICLETLASQEYDRVKPYQILQPEHDPYGRLVICWQALWHGLFKDSQSAQPIELIAARFHKTLVRQIVQTIKQLRLKTEFETVVLSGGVIQNSLLTSGLQIEIADLNLNVMIPENIPANDGGISFGQAVIAAAQITTSPDSTS